MPELADHVHGLLAAQGLVVIDGETIRLPSHQAKLSGRQEHSARDLLEALREAGPRGLTATELAGRVEGDGVDRVLQFLVRQGTARRVGKDRYYEREALERLAHDVVTEVAQRGRATPSELKQRTGLTRKFLIPVLEWLDQEGYTVREGDARRLGPRAEQAGALDPTGGGT